MKQKLKHILIRVLFIYIGLLIRKTDLPRYNKILVIAPHPDDEIFGLGGTIMHFLNQSCQVAIIYMTEGGGSDTWPDEKEIETRRCELSQVVMRKLGIQENLVFRINLVDGEIPRENDEGYSDVVGSLKERIDLLKPEAVYVTHTQDYWPFDHVACAEIALEAASKSEVKPHLWYYWVWAWYNVKPWMVISKKNRKIQKIDISSYLIEKKRLMGIYLNSFTPDGKPWSGIIPPPLLKAFKFPFEVVERIV